jgi:hypothetical protein
MVDKFKWKDNDGQSVWTKVSFAFALFYFGEAILFWQGLALATPLMRISYFVPLIYPLAYWASFGGTVYWITQQRVVERDGPAARFLKWQSALLTIVITTGVIGVAFVVMRGSGNTTLGHVALFFAMFLAAGVIGASEINIGWLCAAILWLVTAIAIYVYPRTLNIIPMFNDEDIWLGLAIAAGFFVIGRFPQSVDCAVKNVSPSGTS